MKVVPTHCGLMLGAAESCWDLYSSLVCRFDMDSPLMTVQECSRLVWFSLGIPALPKKPYRWTWSLLMRDAVHAYLRRLTWNKDTPGETTWIELALDFEAASGTCLQHSVTLKFADIKDLKGKAKTFSAIVKALAKEFKVPILGERSL